MHNFVLFTTDLFVSTQPDDDIDCWFVGADCAGWFYARLLPVEGIDPPREPVMEDWGWTFGLSLDRIGVWVNVWRYYELANCWLLGVEARKRLLRPRNPQALEDARDTVARQLDAIIREDSRFAKHQWYDRNPFTLGVIQF